jgi:hypothetical protein
MKNSNWDEALNVLVAELKKRGYRPEDVIGIREEDILDPNTRAIRARRIGFIFKDRSVPLSVTLMPS